MPLIKFTKLTDKVRGHVKRQTIRKPRKKNPLKEGDTLYVYTLEKLGEAPITKITRKRLVDLTEEDAQKDGFDTISQCIYVLQEIHKADIFDEFDVIEFDPHWKANVIVEVD